MDWADGAYEDFAPELQAGADHVVALTAVRPGERALDVGCGSGNATLLLAAAGATTTGVDPAARLVDVARARLDAAGHDADWHVAGAEALPLPDASFDVVASVFAVIFSEQPAHALDELLRVTAPGGRILVSAWRPAGAIHDVGRLARAELEAAAGRAAVDVPAGGMDWHDPATFASLVPGGEDVIEVHEGTLTLADRTARAWVERQGEHHPVWRAVRATTTPARWGELVDASVERLEAASTARDSMAVPAPYRVVVIRPDPS